MTENTFDKLKKIIDKELGIEDGRIVVTPTTRFDLFALVTWQAS